RHCGQRSHLVLLCPSFQHARFVSHSLILHEYSVNHVLTAPELTVNDLRGRLPAGLAQLDFQEAATGAIPPTILCRRPRKGGHIGNAACITRSSEPAFPTWRYAVYQSSSESRRAYRTAELCLVRTGSCAPVVTTWAARSCGRTFDAYPVDSGLSRC